MTHTAQQSSDWTAAVQTDRPAVGQSVSFTDTLHSLVAVETRRTTDSNNGAAGQEHHG